MNTLNLKKVQWRDLCTLTKWEIFIENTLTLPWLAASWLLAWLGWYWLAVPFSFVFFLTALRQVHNGFHKALGTGKFFTWFSLFSNSILMMASIHAVKFNHLRHHKYCLTEEDHEGHCARLPWYKALLYGPVHIAKIHYFTFKLGNRNYRLNMLAELLALTTFAALSFIFDIDFLKYHVVIMLFGEAFSAFFAVWSVHHDCEDAVGRTQRSWWKNAITYNMFYHLEHHLFPAVPTIKLPELARRLDVALPQIPKHSTF